MTGNTAIDIDSKKRSAIRRRVAIIGAGPGGLCTAIKLQEAGYEDFVIFEKSAGVGGTWFNNRYPGLSCDVPSHLYSFSFLLRPEWTRAYAGQPEILNYMGRVAENFGLLNHVRLSCEVTGLRWNEDRSTWSVTLDKGEVSEFDFVVSAIGMFNLLKWPEIPGLSDFEGTLFHSARWDEEHDLTGERVAVIGSAASAVQFVPRIAEKVKQLHLFQRSPNWVLPKDDPIYDKDTLSSRLENTGFGHSRYTELYEEMDSFCNWTTLEDENEFRLKCLDNLMAVEDPELRRKLTPDFSWGCTRPLFSNEYYPAMNRPNVEVICDGISRLTKDGIVDGLGVERKVDTVICATGYYVDRFLSAIDVQGRGGLDVKTAWQDGAKAYLGVVSSGFPNLFMIYGPNTNNGSLLFMLECQANYITRAIEGMDEKGLKWIDVRPEVMEQYNGVLQEDIAKVKIWQGGCHNYYKAASGVVVTQYPRNMSEYRRDTTSPNWDHFECGPSKNQASAAAE